MAASSSPSNSYELEKEQNLESANNGIALIDEKLAALEKNISAIEDNDEARAIARQNSINKIRDRIKSVTKSAAVAEEEAFELEKWGATAYKIAEDPENSPFKLMVKTLNKGFGYLTYGDQVATADSIFMSWVDSLKGNQTEEQQKREQKIHNFFLGPEKQVLIANAFPQYFNRFEFQGNQSKQIETWYSPDSWKGVGEAYYQEAAWRRSVLHDLRNRLLSLEWILYKTENSPLEDLPNQPTPQELEDMKSRLQREKTQAEAKLQEYKARSEKNTQSLIQHGAEEAPAEETSELLTSQVMKSEDLAEEENVPAPTYTPRGNMVPPIYNLDPDSKWAQHVQTSRQPTEKKSAPTYSHESVRGALKLATSDPIGQLISPFMFGMLQQVGQKPDLPEDYEMLSSSQVAIADKFRAQGASIEEAITYALAVESHPEFANLSLTQLDRMNKYLKQGVTQENAYKFALVKLPETFEMLSQSEQDEVLKYIAGGTPVNQAINIALQLSELRKLTRDQQRVVESFVKNGLTELEAIEIVKKIGRPPNEYYDLTPEQQKIFTTQLKKGLRVEDALQLAKPQSTTPTKDTNPESLTSDQQKIFNSFVKNGIAKEEAIEIAQRLNRLPDEYYNLTPDQQKVFSTQLKNGLKIEDALKLAQLPGQLPTKFTDLNDKQKIFAGQLIASGYSESEAIAEVLLMTLAKPGSASQKGTGSQGKEMGQKLAQAPISTLPKPEGKADQSGQHVLNPATQQFMKHANKLEVEQGRLRKGWGQIRNQLFGRSVQGAIAAQGQIEAEREILVQAQQPAGAVGRQGSKESLAAGTGLAAGGIKALVSKALDAAVGAISPVLLAAKKVIAKVWGLIPEEWKKKAKEFLLAAGTGFYILLSRMISAFMGTFSPIFGGLFGGGAVAAPGAAVALPAGVAFGTGVNAGSSVFGGIFGGGTSTGVAGGGGGSGFGAGFLASTAAPPLIGVATVFAATFYTASTLIGSFQQIPEGTEVYEAPNFTISKEIVSVNGNKVTNNQIPNIGAGTADIVYKITFTSKGEAISLDSFTDTATSYKSGRDPQTLTPSPEPVEGQQYPTALAANESKSVDVSVSITGGADNFYDDSTLVNLISATGKVTKKDEEGKEEEISQTQSASVSLRIGNPVDGPPYGFPIAGPIRSLDLDYIPGAGCLPSHTHCGSFEGSAVFGGMDISAIGEIRSTIDGKVSVSLWDKNYGGKLVVVSESGQYHVLFMHIKDPTPRWKKGDHVSRGEVVGEIYPSKLPNTGGAHLHYQILKDGVNLPFATADAGPCSLTGDNIMTTEQKALIQERVDDHTEPIVSPTITSGPFECQ